MKSTIKNGICSFSKIFVKLLIVVFCLSSFELKAQREIYPWEPEFDSSCLAHSLNEIEPLHLTYSNLTTSNFKNGVYFTFNNFYSEYNKIKEIDTICIMDKMHNNYIYKHVYNSGYLVESFQYGSILKPKTKLNQINTNKYLVHSTYSYSKSDSGTMVSIHRQYFPESEVERSKESPSAIYVDDQIRQEQLSIFFDNKKNMHSFYKKNEMSETSYKFIYIDNFLSDVIGRSMYKVNPDSEYNYITEAGFHIEYLTINTDEIRLKQKEILRRGIGSSSEMKIFFDTLKSNMSVMDIYAYRTTIDKNVQRDRGQFHYLGNERLSKRNIVYLNIQENRLQYYVEGKFDSRNETHFSPNRIYFNNNYVDISYKKEESYEMNQLFFKDYIEQKWSNDINCCYVVGGRKISMKKTSKNEVSFSSIKMDGTSTKKDYILSLISNKKNKTLFYYIKNHNL